MDKQTQNLKKSPERLFVLLQEKTKTQVLGLIGHSNYNSCFDVWQYDLVKNFFFRREMILFFSKDDNLISVDIKDYLLGIKIKEYSS